MNLYIREHDDYRDGKHLTVFDVEDLKLEYESEDSSDDDNMISDEKFKIRLDMDEDMLDVITLNNIFNDTYAIYLICGEGYHEPEKTKIIHIINQDNEIHADNILKNLYSDINNHQPFVQTGTTCSYKPEGYYPEALPKCFVNNHPLLNEEITTLLDKGPYYCVAVIIHNENLIDYLQMSNH